MSSKPLLILLAGLLTLGCLTLGSMPPARAAAPAPVSIALTSLSPTIAGPGEPITVTGTITNSTDHALAPSRVHIGVGSDLLDTVTAVRDWTAGKLTRSTPGVAGASVPSLVPGETEPFVATIGKKALHYPYGLASLPMTVQLIGPGVTASLRTTLEWSTRSPAHTMATSFVVPLTLPADPELFGPSGAKRTAAWAATIGPGSRTDRLLTALQGLPITWVVDPALVDPPAAADHNLPAVTTPPTPTPTPSGTPTDSSPAGTPSTAPATPSPSPSTAAPTVQSLAQALLTRLSRLPGADTVWWTPYGDPDLATLQGTAAGRALLTRDLRQPLPTGLSAISTQRVAWPDTAIGRTQAGRLTATWRRATGKAPTLLLAGRSLAGSTAAPNATRRAAGTSGVIAYDDSMSGMLADAGSAPVLAGQRLLAITAATYQQSPQTTRSLAVVVPREDTTPPEQLATVIAGAQQAPWLSAVGGDQILQALPSQIDAQVLPEPSAGVAARRSPIDADTYAELAHDRRVLTGLGSMLVDSAGVVQDRLRALDVVGSTRWRGHAAALTTTQDAESAAIRSMRSKVTVIPSTVNFFANSGRLTVTVVNDLNRPLKGVRLSLHPRRFLLRIQSPDQVLQIRASSRSTARFQVNALAAGQVPIDAVLRTPNGLVVGAPHGEATQLRVNVRPTASWIYWVLGIVAGLVLVIGLARTLRRGPRQVSPGDAPDPNDAPDREPTPEARQDD